MSVVYKINGREMSREEFNAYEFTPPVGYKRSGAPMVTRTYRHAQPLVSESAAVHPMDARAAEEAATRIGVPTHFNALGQPEFTSMVHRDRYLKTQGMHVKGRAKYRSTPQKTPVAKRIFMGGA